MHEHCTICTIERSPVANLRGVMPALLLFCLILPLGLHCRTQYYMLAVNETQEPVKLILHLRDEVEAPDIEEAKQRYRYHRLERLLRMEQDEWPGSGLGTPITSARYLEDTHSLQFDLPPDRCVIFNDYWNYDRSGLIQSLAVDYDGQFGQNPPDLYSIDRLFASFELVRYNAYLLRIKPPRPEL